ncbi:RNA-binding protein [Paenibacillus physcomitrellae]|uniref:RNA-binding protein YlmH n=1 Tax=Paenibacillus physcomitrellae TaxID=1619311 RepID=A0ABQ1FM64_9BACL|nr:YlmH/Sll1252 family protein [Paenibacillus physcomitrellae]GGA20976.1 putative RNA-binding protein YlmH [Paenibacillus physcomitrellae]
MARTDDIYVHFLPEEKPFIDRAWEWVVNAGDYHEVKLTGFLDPRQSLILTSLANRHPDVAVRLDGGYDGAERRRALIAPDYRDLNSEPMDMKVISVTSEDERLAELDHGDYMGAILGLGLKRDVIGDFHVREDGCHVIVTADIADFLNLHLRQVHRVSVLTDILELEQLKMADSVQEPLDITVASLRLDGIAGDVFRLSRSKILAPIKAGRCRVNWKTEEDPSKPLKAGDVVSLQGFGRFKVLELEGMTKKGRYRVKIGKFV